MHSAHTMFRGFFLFKLRLSTILITDCRDSYFGQVTRTWNVESRQLGRRQVGDQTLKAIEKKGAAFFDVQLPLSDTEDI